MPTKLSSSESPKKECYWILHPIVGLSITDDEASFENWLLDGMTIFSKKHLQQIIDRLVERITDEKHRIESQEGLIKLLDPQNRYFDSYLAVRIYAKEGTDSDKIHELVKDKIHCIGAFLTVFLYVNHKNFRSAKLTSGVRLDGDIRAGISFESTRIFYGTVRPELQEPYFFENNFQKSYDELKNLIYSDFFPIGHLFLSNQKQNQSIKKTVRAAIIRLSEAYTNRNPISRFLEAYISIEVLLSSGRSHEKTIKARLKILLQNSNLITDYIDPIMDVRNKYVHDGVFTKDSKMVENVLILAMATLVAFTYYIQDYNSKEEFLTVLDILHSSQKIKDLSIGMNTKFFDDFKSETSVLKRVPQLWYLDS